MIGRRVGFTERGWPLGSPFHASVALTEVPAVADAVRNAQPAASPLRRASNRRWERSNSIAR